MADGESEMKNFIQHFTFNIYHFKWVRPVLTVSALGR